MEQIRKNPHDTYNIEKIGVAIQSLGELMQEYDYVGVIKLGLGCGPNGCHTRQAEILDKIASIVRMIRDGTKAYYYHSDFSDE
jgi:hypothetical protein